MELTDATAPGDNRVHDTDKETHMTTDAKKPLAPLDPHVVEHLNSTLGKPKPVFMAIVGDRDIHADCWEIGRGRIEAGDPKARRYTEVKIWLTPGGTLITNCTKGTTDGPIHTDSGTGCAHQTPAAALQWLLDDGKGKLGPASKAAWVAACRAVPPMADFEFERIA
jgi:hypothetical protein